MPKEYRYEFTVVGRGQFPVDMLRYDACWPKREAEDSISISASFAIHAHGTEEITLIGVKAPTEARWESFGWKVKDGFKRYSFT
jgi:hypothetical protein